MQVENRAHHSRERMPARNSCFAFGRNLPGPL
nr:MAG TPA: hypothetical protein [Caudoviricetes sp.]